MTELTLIDSTRSHQGDEWQTSHAHELAAFLRRRRRLPTFARTHGHHAASVRAPTSSALVRALRHLQGKFVVVNPSLSVALPADTAAAVRRIIREHAGRRGAVLERAATCALGLYEPASVQIHHRARIGPVVNEAEGNLEFFADVCYQLVIFLDDSASAAPTGLPARPRDVHTLAAGAGGGHLFTLRLYTPDEEALRQMTGAAALLYKRITGRLGGVAPDSYWHLETWERFQEPGRRRGCIIPATHGEHIRGAARSRAEPSRDDWLYGSGSTGGYSVSRWQELSPTFDRASFVPPGYCLITYTGRVELSVVGGG